MNTITEEELCLIHTEGLIGVDEQRVTITPLCVTIAVNSLEATTYLNRMDKREVDTRIGSKCTCLMMAASKGNLSAVKRLILEFGADVNAQCDGRHNAMCNAIREGHVAVVDIFLEHARAQGGEEGRQTLLKFPRLCSPNLCMVFLAIERHCEGCSSISIIEHLCAKGK